MRRRGRSGGSRCRRAASRRRSRRRGWWATRRPSRRWSSRSRRRPAGARAARSIVSTVSIPGAGEARGAADVVAGDDRALALAAGAAVAQRRARDPAGAAGAQRLALRGGRGLRRAADRDRLRRRATGTSSARGDERRTTRTVRSWQARADEVAVDAQRPQHAHLRPGWRCRPRSGTVPAAGGAGHRQHAAALREQLAAEAADRDRVEHARDGRARVDRVEAAAGQREDVAAVALDDVGLVDARPPGCSWSRSRRLRPAPDSGRARVRPSVGGAPAIVARRRRASGHRGRVDAADTKATQCGATREVPSTAGALGARWRARRRGRRRRARGGRAPTACRSPRRARRGASASWVSPVPENWARRASARARLRAARG